MGITTEFRAYVSITIIIFCATLASAQVDCPHWNTFQLFEAADIHDIKDCLSGGSNVNAVGPSGETPLHVAAIESSVDVNLLLIKQGANVNAKGPYGATPLHFASFERTADIIRALIDNGANVNARDERGGTPLHNAANSQTADVIQLLVKHGAKVNVKNKEGWDAAARGGSEGKFRRS